MSLTNFFETSKLYEGFLLKRDFNNSISKDEYNNPLHFERITFEYLCENEQKVKTFETEVNKISQYKLSGVFGVIDKKYLDKDGKLDFVFIVNGKCKSCNAYYVNFALRLYSTDKINPSKGLIDAISSSRGADLTQKWPISDTYIQKIGLYPEFKIEIDKSISKFFDRESSTWYYKAVDLMNKNYGIGAFAYFRRIIEKELMHIIDSIKKLPGVEEKAINKLLELYEKKPTTATIYENIFQYLPASLKELGDNPIKLLYNQTSEGLHNLSEEDCLLRAKSIEAILKFTLIKIYEDRSHILDVKNAIKALKS